MGYNVNTGQYYNDLNPNNYDPNAASAFYAIDGSGKPIGDPTFGGYGSLDAYNQAVASMGDRYNYMQQYNKAHGIATGPADGAVTRGISNNAPGTDYGAIWAANAAKRAANGNTLPALYQKMIAPKQGVDYNLAKQIWAQAGGDPAKEAALLNGALGHMGGTSGQAGIWSALSNMGINPGQYFDQYGGFANWAAQNPGTNVITMKGLSAMGFDPNQLGANVVRDPHSARGQHQMANGGVAYGANGQQIGGNQGGPGALGTAYDPQLNRSNTGPYANGSWVPPNQMGSFDTSKYQTFNPNLINSAAPNSQNDPTGSLGQGPATTMGTQSVGTQPQQTPPTLAQPTAPAAPTNNPFNSGSGGFLGRQGNRTGDRNQMRWGQ